MRLLCFAVKPRKTTMAKGNNQLNLFNVIAIKHRVPSAGITHQDKVPQCTNSDDFPLSAILPSDESNACLKNEFQYLMGKILLKYESKLSWMEEHIPKFIMHDQMKYTVNKS